MIEEESQDEGDLLGERVLPFLRTHPNGADRLANIQKHLPKAKKLYEKALQGTKAQQVRAALNPTTAASSSEDKDTSKKSSVALPTAAEVKARLDKEAA